MENQPTEKKNLVFKWILKNMALITLLLTITAIVISLFFVGIDANVKIVSLLVIIVTEFFIVIFCYLERIAESTKKIDTIIERIPTTGYSTLPQEYDKCKYAQNSIFISGVGMNNIYGVREMLADIKSSVSITLAVNNYEEPDVMTALYSFFGKPSKKWDGYKTFFNESVKKIKNRPDRPVKVIYMDTFVPIAFFAIDYKEETDNSFIQAKHYILSDELDHDKQNGYKIKGYYYTARPRTDSYKLYREYLNQILLIENSKGVLSKKGFLESLNSSDITQKQS
ncbi:MAG: hypothetical protein FWC41_03415 [Firmicutes bacterium]|nr:hypothetical protein [Bacillota bacterium]